MFACCEAAALHQYMMPYCVSLRGTNMLWLSKVRSTKHGLWSFYYFAVKTWNTLPDSVHGIAGRHKGFLGSIHFFFSFMMPYCMSLTFCSCLPCSRVDCYCLHFSLLSFFQLTLMSSKDEPNVADSALSSSPTWFGLSAFFELDFTEVKGTLSQLIIEISIF